VSRERRSRRAEPSGCQRLEWPKWMGGPDVRGGEHGLTRSGGTLILLIRAVRSNVSLTRANVDGSGFPTRSARLVLLTRDQHDSTQDQGASCSVAIGTGFQLIPADDRPALRRGEPLSLNRRTTSGASGLCLVDIRQRCAAE